jgi:hypothetical protein
MSAPAALRPRGAGLAARQLTALGLVGIALGLAVVALLGPLGTGVIDYRVSETLRNQTVGLDAASLVVVAPVAVAAALLVLHDRVLGAVLGLGVGSYTSYMFVQYVVGPDYAHLPGNNERLFPLALLLFAGGWAVVVGCWQLVGADDLRLPPRRERLIRRYVLPLLGLAAFGRYLPALADWMSGAPTDAGYVAGPNFAWTIALLDLGVFAPLTVAACVALARRRSWAPKLLCAVLGWFALVGPAVAAMAIAMAVNDDPNGSVGVALFMSGLGLAFVAVAVVAFQPLLRRGLHDGSPADP